MKSETNSSSPAASAGKSPHVKIIGVGTAGTLIVNGLERAEFAPAEFAFINTDSSAMVGPSRQLLLESKPLRGLGTGGDPERGRKLAEENFEALKAICADAEVVFLVAGLGGGAGSGVLPVLARAAREQGALTLAFVSLPFECEGNRRAQLAQQALAQLQKVCDGLLCLPNEKAFQLLPANVGFLDAFRRTSQFLVDGLRGIWRLLQHRGMIEIHFDELCAVLRERHGESHFATVAASGAERTNEVIAKIPAHPLLDGGKALESAASVIVSILGGPDLGMTDVNRVMADINQRCPKARVIMGAAVAEDFSERLVVTIIATHPRKAEPTKVAAAAAAEEGVLEPTSEFGAELLHPTEPERPKTRMVPPAPALSLEQREEIISKQTGKPTRARKAQAGPRMRQTTLPLDIVNKGRFDKSEPTIHKGEDLDLPTYIRRGIALN
ncbi:MAG: cell division protein FtsZ [Verrucomicrobiota bacterium]